MIVENVEHHVRKVRPLNKRKIQTTETKSIHDKSLWRYENTSFPTAASHTLPNVKI